MDLRSLPVWSWVAPIAAWLLIVLGVGQGGGAILLGTVLVVTVIAAVHHAEVVAHRVGEPYGTLTLAVAVTVIEVGLIISLMLAADGSAPTLARDTVFAAVMIILNGLVGLCLLIGGWRHREQSFTRPGVSASMATLAALTVLTLILPNHTVSAPGPVYTSAQLAFVALVALILYGTFVMVQTVRHRDYFLPKGEQAADEEFHADPPEKGTAILAFAILVICLAAVILMAKKLSPTIGALAAAAPSPEAVVGVAISAIVLMPEGLAAVRAARANRLQTSVNLALGSALATIGLSIPAVAAVALVADLPIALGLDDKGTVLLALTLLVSALTFSIGRTTVLQGVVHLVIFAVFLFTTVVP